MDLLNDSLLKPHFVWDAQHLYKYNGEHFERFIDEPWTANWWWDVQVCILHMYPVLITDHHNPIWVSRNNKTHLLEVNVAPFAFILYTNKSHLSSWGKVKAYPVITHCGNLPTDIRNSNRGLGGSWLVG
jgi:hypothetical protein